MRLLSIITISAGLLMAAPAQAKTKIFACEPEWAALAQEVGGDKVEAYSATHAKQDPHHIRAKPSLIAKMRNADLVVCSGAGLEVGWLPILLQKAGNAKMQPGGDGYLMASEYVNVLEKPVVLDRSLGDIHPEGNPHVHLNPYNLLKVGKELSNRLMRLDAKNADYYAKKYADFSKELSQKIAKWESEAAGLAGKDLIVYHKNFSYLLDWLKIKEAINLEEKSGVPPTSRHLEKVLQTAKSNDILAIVRAPYSPDDASNWLAEKTDIPNLVLPFTIGGSENSNSLEGLFEDTIRMLKDAK